MQTASRAEGELETVEESLGQKSYRDCTRGRVRVLRDGGKWADSGIRPMNIANGLKLRDGVKQVVARTRAPVRGEKAHHPKP
jgi:hypothetical protein